MEIYGIDERCIGQLIEFHQGIIQFWDKERTVVDSHAVTDATFEEVLAYAITTAGEDPFELYVETTGNPLGHPACEYLLLPVDGPRFSVNELTADEYHPAKSTTVELTTAVVHEPPEHNPEAHS